jgi:glutathione S-transferase
MQAGAMAEITFHSMPDSAYLWTAMHVADEKGVTYAHAPLVYNSPEHLALHPFGKMPVMQHGDFFLFETIAIAHYIDRAFAGPPLQPADARGQAETLRWIGIVNSYVFATMHRFMKERIVRPMWGIEPDAAFIAGAREPLTLQVRLIEEALAARAFLAADQLTLADCFLLPHLLFFSLTPEGEALLGEAPRTRAWLTRQRNRPSYLKSPMSDAFDVFTKRTQAPSPLWSVLPAAPTPAPSEPG